MSNKTYEIEIINWEWVSCQKRGYFSTNACPRIKKFKTQKAARAWLAANGFEPYSSRPTASMYHSPRDRYGHSGTQATIKEFGNRYWIESSAEGRTTRSIQKTLY